MFLKPVVRWTLGPVCDAGIEILRHSVQSWRQVYGAAFSMFICYNDDRHLSALGDLGCDLVSQRDYMSSLPMTPFDTCWKLFPPRLSQESHEVVLDNDLVIYDRLPELDRFLSESDVFLVSAAYRRFYGQYLSVAPPIAINGGFFALPPGFDFGRQITRLLRVYPFRNWSSHCDDEGVLGCVLGRQNLTIVPMEHLSVCNPQADFAPYRLGKFGTHFAACNSGHVSYWERFKQERQL